jgi:hypothetical protein
LQQSMNVHITSKSTRTKNSGLFASLHFSPLFLACY